MATGPINDDQCFQLMPTTGSWRWPEAFVSDCGPDFIHATLYCSGVDPGLARSRIVSILTRLVLIAILVSSHTRKFSFDAGINLANTSSRNLFRR
jgi:hypothetical protein